MIKLKDAELTEKSENEDEDEERTSKVLIGKPIDEKEETESPFEEKEIMDDTEKPLEAADVIEDPELIHKIVLSGKSTRKLLNIIKELRETIKNLKEEISMLKRARIREFRIPSYLIEEDLE